MVSHNGSGGLAVINRFSRVVDRTIQTGPISQIAVYGGEVFMVNGSSLSVANIFGGPVTTIATGGFTDIALRQDGDFIIVVDPSFLNEIRVFDTRSHVEGAPILGGRRGLSSLPSAPRRRRRASPSSTSATPGPRSAVPAPPASQVQSRISSSSTCPPAARGSNL